MEKLASVNFPSAASPQNAIRCLGMTFNSNQMNGPQPPDEEILDMMRRLYPRLNEEQIRTAKDNLERDLKLAWRIASRLEREERVRSFDSTRPNS